MTAETFHKIGLKSNDIACEMQKCMPTFTDFAHSYGCMNHEVIFSIIFFESK